MKNEKLIVGQTVWIVNCGGGRRNLESPQETKIASVAKKYFTVEGRYKRFHIQTLKEDAGQYTPDLRVVLDLETYEQEKELNRIWAEIRANVTGRYTPTIDLKTAKEILTLLTQ